MRILLQFFNIHRNRSFIMRFNMTILAFKLDLYGLIMKKRAIEPNTIPLYSLYQELQE